MCIRNDFIFRCVRAWQCFQQLQNNLLHRYISQDEPNPKHQICTVRIAVFCLQTEIFVPKRTLFFGLCCQKLNKFLRGWENSPINRGCDPRDRDPYGRHWLYFVGAPHYLLGEVVAGHLIGLSTENRFLGSRFENRNLVGVVIEVAG